MWGLHGRGRTDLHAHDLLVGVLAAVHHQLHAPLLLAVLAGLLGHVQKEMGAWARCG